MADREWIITPGLHNAVRDFITLCEYLNKKIEGRRNKKR